ncbi:hypothetical protein N7530_012749 [Penicillium desertorum]|uniref:Uncharacterized protein n=1 Tax=Penicillium desertorum TaxID=1303715 RepID=A0A9W9WDC0_9EURO|nr:hypothetical protein N7530_012749 [Penicillium desertorum]
MMPDSHSTMSASPHQKEFFVDILLSVHCIGEKDLFIRKGVLVVENRLRQIIRQFPACLSFFGIGARDEYRILFRLRTEYDEFDIIGPFLRILLSLLPSIVVYGRLSYNDECVGGWLFADRADGELLRVEDDDEDEESDSKPQFIGSVPVSRNAASEGLSHLYNGHDLWSDALNSERRDIGACMKLDQLHDCRIVNFGRVCGVDDPLGLLYKVYQESGQLEVGDIAVIGYEGELARRICGLQK